MLQAGVAKGGRNRAAREGPWLLTYLGAPH
jgi:hypothetical protein